MIWPAAPLETLLLGWPKSGVLETLKTSQRNSTLVRSRMGKLAQEGGVEDVGVGSAQRVAAAIADDTRGGKAHRLWDHTSD